VRLVEQQRVFPQPTQTAYFASTSLLDRSRVHVRPCLECAFKSFAQGFNERVQSLPQRIVIIVAPGITGNPPTRVAVIDGQRRIGGKRLRGVVVEQTNDGAPDAGHGGLGIGSPGICEVLHFAGVAPGEPLGHPLQFGKLFRADHAAKVETQRFRLSTIHNVSASGIIQKIVP